MADNPILGSIPVQSENAPISDPESVGHQDTLANIAKVGAGIVDTAKTQLTEGLRDEFSDATDAALAGGGQPTEETLGFVAPSSQDQFLIDKIATLQAGIAQSSGSAKARLELELRQKASQLGDRFPGLRDEISATQTNFARTDPEFAALDLLDASSKSFAAEQAKELDLIRSTAYGSISSGGLGMVPGRVTFGSPEFAREYNYQAGLRERANRNNATNEALNAEETMDARGYANNFHKQIQGQESQVSDMIRETRDQVRSIANAALDISQPGAAESLASWEAGGRDEALSQVANSIFTIEDWFSDIPVSMGHTPSYASAKALKDQTVGALNKLSQAVITGDWTMVQAWEAQEVMREIEFARDNPELNALGEMMDNNSTLFEAISQDFSANGEILMNDIAGLINQSLPHVVGRAFGMSQLGSLPAGASVDQIMNAQRAIRSQNPNLYGNGQTTPEGVQTNATIQHQQSFNPAILTQAASNDGKGLSPNVAAALMAGSASATEHMLFAGELPVDAAEPHLAVLADKNVIDLVNQTRASATPAAAVAAGQQYQSLQFQDQPRRLASYEALRNVNLNGVPAKQVITIDPSKLEEGKIVFRADAERVRTLVPKETGRLLTGQLGIGGLRPQATALQQAQTAAAELTRLINKDLAVQAHVAYMLTGAEDVDYEAAWEAGGFMSKFGVVPVVRREPDIELDLLRENTGNSAATRIRRGQ